MKRNYYPVRFRGGIRLAFGSQLLKSEQGEDRLGFGMLNSDTSFVSIFDGHAGVNAAQFCSENCEPVFKSCITDYNNINEGIKKGCYELEKLFYETHPNDKSGTTLVTLIQHFDTISISWIGDSDAYIFDRNGNYIQITDPPHVVEDEKQREYLMEHAKTIKSAKFLESHKDFQGVTEEYQYWFSSNNKKLTVIPPTSKQLGGPPETSIAVSRAIGDVRFGSLLLPEPEIKTFKLEETKIIILGSDGLWDVINPDDVINVFNETNMFELLKDESMHLPNNEKTVKETIYKIGNILAELAIERWGKSYRDDISIFVCWMQVPLKDSKDEAKIEKTINI